MRTTWATTCDFAFSPGATKSSRSPPFLATRSPPYGCQHFAFPRFCEMIDCRAISSNRSVAGRRRVPGAPPQAGGCGMKHDWNADELLEHWTLLPGEKRLLANKSGPTRLGFAVLLKFFQHEGRFPRQGHDVPDVAVEYVARQTDVSPGEWARYDWDGRTIKYHRAQIRAFLGFREATVEDGEALAAWLAEHVVPHDQNPDHLSAEVLVRCRALHIEPPAPERIDRLVRS